MKAEGWPKIVRQRHFGLLPYLRSCHHIMVTATERKIAVGVIAAAIGGQS
jgi:hypothetical protein